MHATVLSDKNVDGISDDSGKKRMIDPMVRADSDAAQRRFHDCYRRSQVESHVLSHQDVPNGDPLGIAVPLEVH